LNLAGSATEWMGQIEVFHYPAIAGDAEENPWGGFPEVGSADRNVQGHTGHQESGAGSGNASFEQRVAEESKRSFEAGRERGRQEGCQAEREVQAAAHSAWEEKRARQGAELIAAFAGERDRYLRAVEHEVVKLALAVAARILRREAQMDPLLLTGAVRVALGQLAASTQVRLRVPPADLSLWTDALALLPNLSVKPQVVAGEGMRLGECLVETELGSVDIGIRSQLGEIERGFFDRAGGAPAQSPEPAQSATVGAER
jgi:flagellar biosynthesis/type III secretory pathway protein FliH